MRGRGFTLIEMMVVLLIGTFLALAAFTLTADMGRLRTGHIAALELHQNTRHALHLIETDLMNAGVGVGYLDDGSFAGIIEGSFEVAGGATFVADDRALTGVDGALLTDDLGVRRALGERRTILALGEGTGELCSGLSFDADELVVASARSGVGSFALRIDSSAAASCTRGLCAGGCTAIEWTADEEWSSSADLSMDIFSAGDLFTEYATVVWFVTPDADGLGQLRRVASSQLDACTAVGMTCGAEVARGVEMLQYAVWWFDADTSTWTQASQMAPLPGDVRLRVDLEIIARARTDADAFKTVPIASQLAPGVCVPAPCGSDLDGVPRLVHRTTVEVRNAGLMRLR